MVYNIKTIVAGHNKNLILYINESMGMPDRVMDLRENSALVECLLRNRASDQPWNRLGSPPSQAAIPSTLKDLLQCFDEALMALGPMRGGLQEATTTKLG